ncbi:MAG: hypothetical protein ACMG6E_10035 [Candidatus Roizmanbacteria bacterium]
MRGDYHIGVKFLILVFVAGLSGLFFWSTSQRFIYPSKAQEEKVRVFFNQDRVKTDDNGMATIDVFLASVKDKLPTTITVPVDYNPDEVEFVLQENNFADSLCRTNGWPYRESNIVSFEPRIGSLIVSRSTGAKESPDEKDGIACWGSYVFQLKEGIISSKIELGRNKDAWEIKRGPVSQIPDYEEGNIITIER